jgi:hypothetical protein
MNIKRTSTAILAGVALFGAGSVKLANAQGTWSVAYVVNPETVWVKNGVVVKATNLGPASGGTINAQPVTVAGITFDTDMSNIALGGGPGSGIVPGSSPAVYYYTGANASVSNMVNTWDDAYRWWSGDAGQNVYINFSALNVGDNYELQLLVGFPWDHDGMNLYGPAAEYQYFASAAGQGKACGMATFTWTAASATAQFNVNLPLYEEAELMAYALIDTSVAPATPTISSPKVLGGGQFQLTINSTAGATLDVLLSHNLVSWTTNQTVTNISGSGIFTNSSATSSPTFYRLLQH